MRLSWRVQVLSLLFKMTHLHVGRSCFTRVWQGPGPRAVVHGRPPVAVVVEAGEGEAGVGLEAGHHHGRRRQPLDTRRGSGPAGVVGVGRAGGGEAVAHGGGLGSGSRGCLCGHSSRVVRS